MGIEASQADKPGPAFVLKEVPVIFFTISDIIIWNASFIFWMFLSKKQTHSQDLGVVVGQ